jgi:hypothetical protein
LVVLSVATTHSTDWGSAVAVGGCALLVFVIIQLLLSAREVVAEDIKRWEDWAPTIKGSERPARPSAAGIYSTAVAVALILCCAMPLVIYAGRKVNQAANDIPGSKQLDLQMGPTLLGSSLGVETGVNQITMSDCIVGIRIVNLQSFPIKIKSVSTEANVNGHWEGLYRLHLGGEKRIFIVDSRSWARSYRMLPLYQTIEELLTLEAYQDAIHGFMFYAIGKVLSKPELRITVRDLGEATQTRLVNSSAHPSKQFEEDMSWGMKYAGVVDITNYTIRVKTASGFTQR